MFVNRKVNVKQFHEQLEEFRETRQISKRDLAVRAGLSLGYVSLLTRGERNAPSEKKVRALADALDLDIKDRAILFESAGYPPYSASALSVELKFPSHLGRKLKRGAHIAGWRDAPNAQYFIGREHELEDLEQWIVSDHCQLVTVFGIGGIGKTMLCTKLVENLQEAFEYIYWFSLQNAPPVENVLKQSIHFFSGQQSMNLPDELDDQISKLIDCLRDHRCLIVLDNFESILSSGNSAGQHQENYEGYGKLLRRVGDLKHQSCLLITSREKPKEIPHLEGTALFVRSLHLTGVKPAVAQEILRGEELKGSDEVWKEFVDLYAGNILALKLISEPIRELFNGEIAAFLQGNEFVTSDIYSLLEQQFVRLTNLEQGIIYWLAIEREAISRDNLRNDIVHLALGELLEALKSLRRRSMVETTEKAYFYLQPVVLEYATNRFVKAIYKELIDENSVIADIKLLMSHAMIKAQAKDYVRENQIRLILRPVAEQMLIKFEKNGSERRLKKILSQLHERSPQTTGYAAGNILNLLVQMNVELQGYNFSHLPVWQAYLQDVLLRDVNFAYSDMSGSVFSDNFGSIFSVALSQDGKWLAAGTANGEVRVWDAINAEAVLVLSGHTEWVRSVAFSPDGDSIASGSEDKTIRIWDINSGECRKVLVGHEGTVYSVAFSPDGSAVASGSDDQSIRLWRVNTGGCFNILQGHSYRVKSVAFNYDGSIVASGGGDRTVRLWNVDTGDCFRILRGHADWIWTLACSPTENIIASGSEDGTIRLWYLDYDKSLKELDAGRVYSLAFSKDGHTLISGSDNQVVQIWNAHTGNRLKTLRGYASRIFSVSFSSDGGVIASGGEDKLIRIWDVQSKENLKVLRGHIHWVWSVCYSSNEQLLASGSEDRTVRIWNAITGECLRVFNGHKNRVYSVAFSPDNNKVASSSGDQIVIIWDITTKEKCLTLKGHTGRVYAIAFSPNGNMVISGSDDRKIKMWEARTGKCLRTLEEHDNRVRSVTFNSDGTILASGSDDRMIKLWESSTGKCLRTLEGHENWVLTVAFSPDGKRIASGSEDCTVRIWDTNTGDCLRILKSSDSAVNTVSFSRDGNTLAIGTHGGLIKLWNVQTGEEIPPLKKSRLYENMNILGIRGLTDRKLEMLKALGAKEYEPNNII